MIDNTILKAGMTPFKYVVLLRGGHTVFFTSCTQMEYSQTKLENATMPNLPGVIFRELTVHNLCIVGTGEMKVELKEVSDQKES